MEFKATEEQVKQIAVNAVTASAPMGMGFLHHQPDQEFKPDDFKIDKFGLSLDYVQGRMVKLSIGKTENGNWQIHGEPRSDYQSWIQKYSTNEELIKSVGAEPVDKDRDK